MNACGSNHCHNSGQCVPEDTQTYRCVCIRGHSGKNCQIFPGQGQLKHKVSQNTKIYRQNT